MCDVVHVEPIIDSRNLVIALHRIPLQVQVITLRSLVVFRLAIHSDFVDSLVLALGLAVGLCQGMLVQSRVVVVSFVDVGQEGTH